MDVAGSPTTNRDQVFRILSLLESISAQEDLNSSILQKLGSKANCMATIASMDVPSRERVLALSVMYNTMASISDFHNRDFIHTNIHHCILYLGLLEFYEDDMKLVKAAADCLNLMLQLGSQIEEDSQIGEPNPVIEYCMQHSGLDNLENAQRCKDKCFREIINDIINKYFT
jgi:hypothetical protein